jgi:transposase, IS30 family
MSYRPLTLEERYTIATMKQAGHAHREIARVLGRPPSTIGREVRRNRSSKGYYHRSAHALARSRRRGKATIKFDAAMRAQAEAKLQAGWSPEQIAGRFKALGLPMVSHQRLYEHIRQDQALGGSLHRFLRRDGKRRKKRYGAKDYRGRIRDRVDIDQRPAVVAAKSRLGDWEGDTIVGGQRQGAVVTLVERRSQYLLMKKVARADAASVTAAVITVAQPHVEQFKTITYDNGREFASHAQMAQALSVDIYFAKPYHSWERGLNENTNGLIRQYIPKRAMLSDYTDDDIIQIQEALNHRPRKTLGYRTPHEFFIERKSRVKKAGVALDSLIRVF